MGSLLRNCPTPVAINCQHNPYQANIVKLTERQHRQRKSHRIILIRRQEEYSIPEPSPDENISNNASNEMRRVKGDRANPIQRDEIPRQRPSNRANMNRPRRRAVAEVREAQIEEIDDQKQLGEPKVASHPEVDEAEEQEIGGYVVRAGVGSGDEVGAVTGPERPRINQLQNEEYNPFSRQNL